jgi:hypothetical protein
VTTTGVNDEPVVVEPWKPEDNIMAEIVGDQGFNGTSGSSKCRIMQFKFYKSCVCVRDLIKGGNSRD